SKVNEIETMIYNKTEHPYVERFIQKPFIDSDKLFVLHHLYEKSSVKDDLKQPYMVSIMLVQMALDTHETIPSEFAAPMQETTKQITVLAGDFYSGLYYYLLADLEDIAMIRTLAHAIEQINEAKMKLYKNDCVSFDSFVQTIEKLEINDNLGTYAHVIEKINEAKMKLYKNDCVSFDSFVQTIEKIETFLLEAVVHETRMDTDTFSIIKQFLTLSRLMSENEKWMNGQVSYIERFAQQYLSDRQMEQYVKEKTNNLKEKFVEQLRQPFVNIELRNYMCEKLNVTIDTTAVEEG